MAASKSKEGMNLKSTKQELLDAYRDLEAKIEEKNEAELKPERNVQEKKAEETMSAVKDITQEKVLRDIDNLKTETGRLLGQLADKIEAEVKRLGDIQAAIALKDREIKEIYDIDRSAATLAALIEAQNQQKQRFAEEMAEVERRLKQEIEETKARWLQEKEQYQAEQKEKTSAETKRRDREKEEHAYLFQREQQLARDKFADEHARLLAEKTTLEGEIKVMRERAEMDFSEREKAIAEHEHDYELLKTRAETFPGELEKAVAKAIQETSGRLKLDADYRTSLLQKQDEGEKNVLSTRIESLEKTVKDQNEQITKLSRQLESAYQKIQDVAVKALESGVKYSTLTLAPAQGEGKKPVSE